MVMPFAKPPTANTKPATNITATSATLNGMVNDNGTVTNVFFDIGLNADYGTSVTATPLTINVNAGDTAVNTSLALFDCSTTYHYRVRAVSSVGTTNGADSIFTTANCSIPCGAIDGDCDKNCVVNALDLVCTVNKILGM